MFSWADPPSTGHLGHEFGCRCWAEPILEDAGEPVQVAILDNGVIMMLEGDDIIGRVGGIIYC